MDQQELANHCKKLSNFSKNPRTENIQIIIKAISDLCLHRAVVEVGIQGYVKCFICKQIGGQPVAIFCKHVVHQKCLEKKAKNMSKDTFDPSMLMQLNCEYCQKLISQQQYTRVIGKRVIETYQDKVNKQLEQEIARIEKQQREEQIARLTFECPTCLNVIKISQGITMSCSENHRFCSDCAEQMIKQQIKEGKYQMNAIVCKYEGCLQPLNQILIRTCIGKQEFEKYINIQSKHLLVEGLEIRQCAGYTYQDGTYLVEFDDYMDEKKYANAQEELERKCKAIQNGQIEGAKLTGPIRKCETHISYDPKENQNGGFLKCWDCMLESCIKGCGSAHRGNTCEKYKEWEATNLKSRQISLPQILALGMAQCQNPNCMRIILKNQGCDHVTCTCGFQICYRCSKPYTVCRAACPARR